MSSLKFRMLGALEVERDGHTIGLAGRQQLALMALLLIHANQPLSADRLVEDLWGEPTPARARKRLQLAITRLRQTIGPALELETTAGGYRLRVGASDLDAEVFSAQVRDGRRALRDGRPAQASEILRGALELWRGPPLADVAHATFAAGEIRRLEEMRLEASEL